MAEIQPFRALRYDPEIVPDPAAVVTPPYDVISPEAALRYHARHPYNAVRLILAREDPPDATGRDRYDRAARAFAAWRAHGVLRRDPEPALYLLEQECTLPDGSRCRRRGILALLKLEEYDRRVIFPHERTFSRHKDDRLRLMRACPANLEAILGFYAGPAEPVTGLLDALTAPPPALQLRDEEGVIHRLWVLADRAGIGRLQAVVASQPVFIADGHHRYETALTFRNERRGGPSPPAEFVLAHLVHAEDPGLVILPTHRLLRERTAVAPAALRERLAAHFDLHETPIDRTSPESGLQRALEELRGEGPERTACALFWGGDSIVRLTLANGSVVEALLAAGHPPAYARLPVAILHRLVIEEILGVPAQAERDDAIGYTRDPREAFLAVRSGRAALAMFLNPPRVEDVRTIASAGGRMPQKSTYFYPKVPSGLVFNPLE